MNQNCLTTDKLETGPKRANYQTERLDPPIVETVTLKTPPGTVREATETVLPQLPKTDVLDGAYSSDFRH